MKLSNGVSVRESCCSVETAALLAAGLVPFSDQPKGADCALCLDGPPHLHAEDLTPPPTPDEPTTKTPAAKPPAAKPSKVTKTEE